jgi:hypothetical protein
MDGWYRLNRARGTDNQCLPWECDYEIDDSMCNGSKAQAFEQVCSGKDMC